MQTLRLNVDTSPAMDALEELERVMRALSRRHGSAFRELDLDIEAFLAAPKVEGHDLPADPGDGATVACTLPQLAAILRRARALRLI